MIFFFLIILTNFSFLFQKQCQILILLFSIRLKEPGYQKSILNSIISPKILQSPHFSIYFKTFFTYIFTRDCFSLPALQNLKFFPDSSLFHEILPKSLQFIHQQQQIFSLSSPFAVWLSLLEKISNSEKQLISHKETHDSAALSNAIVSLFEAISILEINEESLSASEQQSEQNSQNFNQVSNIISFRWSFLKFRKAILENCSILLSWISRNGANCESPSFFQKISSNFVRIAQAHALLRASFLELKQSDVDFLQNIERICINLARFSNSLVKNPKILKKIEQISSDSYDPDVEMIDNPLIIQKQRRFELISYCAQACTGLPQYFFQTRPQFSIKVDLQVNQKDPFEGNNTFMEGAISVGTVLKFSGILKILSKNERIENEGNNLLRGKNSFSKSSCQNKQKMHEKSQKYLENGKKIKKICIRIVANEYSLPEPQNESESFFSNDLASRLISLKDNNLSQNENENEKPEEDEVMWLGDSNKKYLFEHMIHSVPFQDTFQADDVIIFHNPGIYEVESTVLFIDDENCFWNSRWTKNFLIEVKKK